MRKSDNQQKSIQRQQWHQAASNPLSRFFSIGGTPLNHFCQPPSSAVSLALRVRPSIIFQSESKYGRSRLVLIVSSWNASTISIFPSLGNSLYYKSLERWEEEIHLETGLRMRQWYRNLSLWIWSETNLKNWATEIVLMGSHSANILYLNYGAFSSVYLVPTPDSIAVLRITFRLLPIPEDWQTYSPCDRQRLGTRRKRLIKRSDLQ